MKRLLTFHNFLFIFFCLLSLSLGKSLSNKGISLIPIWRFLWNQPIRWTYRKQGYCLIAQLVKNLPAGTLAIPGLSRSTGEGIYSWASLVAQLIKNPSAMWETWVQSLGWEDLLEKGKSIHSSILARRIPWTVYSPWGRRVGPDWVTFTFSWCMVCSLHSAGCLALNGSLISAYWMTESGG